MNEDKKKTSDIISLALEYPKSNKPKTCILHSLSLNPNYTYEKNYLFYAINPQIVPHATKLSLIAVYYNKKTKLVRKVLVEGDPWHNSWRRNTQKEIKNWAYLDIVYFYCWTTPLLNTIPLYVYDTSKTTQLISFDEMDLSENAISPLYVIPPVEYNYDIKSIKFTCYNGVIVPYKDPMPTNLFYQYKPIEPTSFTEAIILCNQIVPVDEGGGMPGSVENIIRSINKKNAALQLGQTEDVNQSNQLPRTIIGSIVFIIYIPVCILLLVLSFQ